MAAPTLKSFISEKEIEEVKRKKQEEWERVRRPDQPLQRPEVEYDHRTLYEKLKAQKDQKQEAWEEQFKFKNMIYKGLNDEEATFLGFVAEKQAQHEAELRREEKEEISAYREAVLRLQEEQLSGNKPQSSSEDSKLPSNSKLGAKSQKSQLSLIAGSIKTKRRRTSSQDENSQESPEKKQKLDPTPKTAEKPDGKSLSGGRSTEEAKPLPADVGTLPGLAAYSSSDSSDDDD